MLKHFKLRSEKAAFGASFPQGAQCLGPAGSWYSLLRGESTAIFAYLILNGPECLASLSGISVRTNDLHIGGVCSCAASLQPNFHVKIFSSCLCYYQPVLFVYSPSCVLPREEYGRVKSMEMAGCSRTGLEMTECHLHTGCQLLLGPVFASTEPLLVVVCLAIT